MLVDVEYGYASLLGRRTSNQDRGACAPPWAFVLDGVGGSLHGAAAAQLGLAQLLLDAAVAPATFDPPAARESFMAELVEAAHRQVSSSLGSGGGSPTGQTTVSMAHFQFSGDSVVSVAVAAVGDSPVWVVGRDSAPVLVTPARGTPRGEAPTGLLGAGEHKAQFSCLTLACPARLVLATDGILALDRAARAGVVGDLRARPQECATRLAEAAIQAGGRDNTTVLVVDLWRGSSGLPGTLLPTVDGDHAFDAPRQPGSVR
ncbi:MAG: hypothetical protein LBD70_03615 [Bifidobacteriaceae bacterium]|jgi:serine/threonine protein phosphatase PrpC|nr:hypothetical protein [Bifidobacteriaceae bacterium]